MRTISVILIICFLVTSCNSKASKPKPPDYLISKDKMEDILYDLYIINAAKGVNKKLLEKNGFVPEAYVLAKHQIDSTQFADSNAYYAYNPDVYQKIVGNVKAKLETQKDHYEELQKIETKAAKQKKDSLKLKRKKKDSLKRIEFNHKAIAKDLIPRS